MEKQTPKFEPYESVDENEYYTFVPHYKNDSCGIIIQCGVDSFTPEQINEMIETYEKDENLLRLVVVKGKFLYESPSPETIKEKLKEAYTLLSVAIKKGKFEFELGNEFVNLASQFLDSNEDIVDQSV